MTQRYNREQLMARLIRAGEIEVSGEGMDTIAEYFDPDALVFDGPGGFQSDYAGLQSYFESLRAAFEDRSITRGIMIWEGNYIACQTRIEGTFVREFTQSPVGVVQPNGRRVIWDLLNLFAFDDAGRIIHEWVRADNGTVVDQLRAPAEASA